MRVFKGGQQEPPSLPLLDGEVENGDQVRETQRPGLCTAPENESKFCLLVLLEESLRC